MNRRLKSWSIIIVLVLSLVLFAIPSFAADTQIKISADKTTASPGDTITFTITLGPVSDLGSMQMVLDIPDGLTYVANSTAIADGVKDTLGFDSLDWTESSMMINGYASEADYASTGDTVIATFQCTVDDGYSGSVTMGLTDLEFYSCITWDEHTQEYSVVSDTVNIEKASEETPDEESSEEVTEATTEKTTEASSEQSSSKDSKSPETSDSQPLVLWVVLTSVFLAAVVTLIIVLVNKRKHSNR